MHSIGVVHNDIKLDNIMIDLREDGGATLYLIDFGLSQKYMKTDSVTGNREHIERKLVSKFTGNFLFASFNSCSLYIKSRRDDLESAFIMIIYLMNKNQLPWSYLAAKDIVNTKLRL